MIVSDTIEEIRTTLKMYRRPAIMWSGGKDSMVLLHLIRENISKDLDVISWRDPWFPHKYDFLQKVASDWNLRVFDWPPMAQGFQQRGEKVLAMMSVYRMGTGGVMMMPKNLQELPEIAKTLPEEYICAAQDFFARPLGDVNYPWDLLIQGQKSCDEEGVIGCDLVKGDPGKVPDMYFPLKNWLDKDVWTYHRENKVPIQKNRYAQDQELESKFYNPDWIPACVRCCDRRRKEAFVPCPKLNGKLVSSIATKVPYYEIGAGNQGLHYYGANVASQQKKA